MSGRDERRGEGAEGSRPRAASRTGPEPALGRDPFAEDAPGDPFLEQIELRAERSRIAAAPTGAPRGPGASPKPPRPPAAPKQRAESAPRADTGQADSHATAAAAPPPGWLERWMGDDVRRRIATLTPEPSAPPLTDPFGLSPDALRTALPPFLALYRHYFRVESRGHEHLPRTGSALLVGNHGGILPFDAAMTVLDVFLHTGPPRIARAIIDRWVATQPWLALLFARLGQVIGTRENFDRLLAAQQLVLVYPEGMAAMRKTVLERYRLRPFHRGFVELALRHRAPIVPVACVGSEDQAPLLFDLEPLARRLGLPLAPVTPTFPWLGPLGLLPYPVRYRLRYGEPIALHAEYGPEAADDPLLVQRLADEVRVRVQALLDATRAQR